MTPVYFIERYYVDNNGNIISESGQILDVLTDQETITEASINHLIRQDQNKEISRAALAKEHFERTKKRRSDRPTMKMRAVSA